jgi:replicative DNA helicase
MIGDITISEDWREEYEREFVTCLILNDEAIKYVRVKPFYLKTEELREIFDGIIKCYNKYKVININGIREMNSKVNVDYYADLITTTMYYKEDWKKQFDIQQQSILKFYKKEVIDSLNQKLLNNEISYEEFTDKIDKIKSIKVDLGKEKSILNITDIDISKQKNPEKIKSNTVNLDNKIKGFTLGELSIWSGGNASGKSSYLNQLALESIKQGYKVVIYSGELDSPRLLNWIAVQCAGLKNMVYDSTYDYYYLSDFTKNIILDWLNGKLFIYDNEFGQDPEVIIDSIKTCVLKNDVKVVILDNLMSMNAPSDNKYDFQSALVKQLSALAKELNIHIHFVCHPRKVTNFLRKVDISGSADLTNIADNVFIIHRVNQDFINQTKEMFHWKDDNEIYGYSNVIEVCKNRDYGIQDHFAGMYYEMNSRRLLDYENEERKYI